MSNALNPRQHHSDECRLRIYLEWKKAGDPKWEDVRHLVELDSRPSEPARAEMDAEDFGPRDRGQPNSPADSSVHGGLEAPTDGRWGPEAFGSQDTIPDHMNPDMDIFYPDKKEDEDMADDEIPDIIGADEWVDDRGPYYLDDGSSDAMIDALVMAGTNEEAARMFTYAVMKKRLPTTFVEIYGRGAIMKEANGPRRALNIEGLAAWI